MVDGHCIIIHNFLQNNFDIEEDLSSSDGESVNISIGSAAQQPAEPAEPQPAEPKLPEPQPAARKSKRAQVPRKLFTL